MPFLVSDSSVRATRSLSIDQDNGGGSSWASDQSDRSTPWHLHRAPDSSVRATRSVWRWLTRRGVQIRSLPYTNPRVITATIVGADLERDAVYIEKNVVKRHKTSLLLGVDLERDAVAADGHRALDAERVDGLAKERGGARTVPSFSRWGAKAPSSNPPNPYGPRHRCSRSFARARAGGAQRAARAARNHTTPPLGRAIRQSERSVARSA